MCMFGAESIINKEIITITYHSLYVWGTARRECWPNLKMCTQPLATTVVGPSTATLTAATSFPFALLFAFAFALEGHLL